MVTRKVYKYRLEPTSEQEHKLSCNTGARRFAFNWGLARRKEHYKTTGKSLSYNRQAAELTELKKSEEWMNNVDSQSLQQSLKDLNKAFVNFFEHRAGFPQFKSRKGRTQSFRVPQRVKVNDNKVYCPKIGWLKFRKSQEIEGTTKSATFKKDATGKWFVCIVTEQEIPDVQLPIPEAVGLDLGLKDFAVLSTGERVESPKFYRQSERKLARAQRVLSRRKKGSNRRRKAKLRVAVVHAKTRNKRNDFLHKVSTGIVSRFNTICIEDLSVKGLAKTKLAKSVCDAGWGEFCRQLAYKVLWSCKRLSKINRWFPSSKLCGVCGEINKNLTLSDREWTCSCGAIHDRDWNAAWNILVEGLVAVGHTETLNFRGACVRPATVGSG